MRPHTMIFVLIVQAMLGVSYALENTLPQSSLINNQTIPHGTRNFIYFPCLILSVPFLVFTFLIYACIKELRSTTHGKCLMCYVLCLTVGYSVLAVVYYEETLPPALCISIGLIGYVSIMSSFLWLAVISFDMWSTFRNCTGSNEERFIPYSIFAWGTATVFLIIATIMQFSTILSHRMRPKFEGRCWFTDRESQFILFSLPLIAVVLINILFFSLTAVNITRAQSEIGHLMRGDSQQKSRVKLQRNTFWLCVRLFVLMGLSWSMEFISWLVQSSGGVFMIFDILNCIQGVPIFFLCACTKRVRTLLLNRCRHFSRDGTGRRVTI